jgi:hypothetical protein
LLTYRNVPDGLTVAPKGLSPATNGDPGTGASVRVAMFNAKAEIVLSPPFATNTNFPAGSTATPWGVTPVVNGDPGSGLRAPLAVLTEKADKLLEFALPTNRKSWTESKAINSAPAPAAKGEPETVERPPEALMANALTVPDPEFATNAKLVVGFVATAGTGAAFIPLPHPFSAVSPRMSAPKTSGIRCLLPALRTLRRNV